MKVKFVTSLLLVSLFSSICNSAIFDGAGVAVSDPNGELSWKSTVNALSVSCWFKISIPSGKLIEPHTKESATGREK